MNIAYVKWTSSLKRLFLTGDFYFFFRNMNNPYSRSTIKQQIIKVRDVLMKQQFPETDSENYQQVKNLGYLGQQR